MTTRKALVLIPGLVCDGAVWAHQCAGLSDVADCMVPEVRIHDTMQAMAEEVLTMAPERFAVAGFSMGGYVALEVLRLAPERVERIALIDSGTRDDTPTQTASRQRAIQLSESGSYQTAIEEMMPLLLHPSRLVEPIADLVRTMAARVGSEAFVRRHKALSRRRDLSRLLPTLTVPLRVICGRDDRLTPLARSTEIAGMAATARLSIVDDCGHMPLIERPQAATALLRDWLIYD